MNYYVFIDDNNGYSCDYYNFMSDATEEHISYATNQMRAEEPVFCRMGSKMHRLEKKLKELNFKVIVEDNPPNRLSIDRIQIHCIGGNY